MTLILFASIAGAALFFGAGLALAALRRHRPEDERTHVRRVDPELARLRDALASAEATVASQAAVIDEQNRLFERDADDKLAVMSREVTRLRADNERLTKEAVAAAATNQELRRTAEERGKQLERAKAEATAAATELAKVQTKLRELEHARTGAAASATELQNKLRELDHAKTAAVTSATELAQLQSKLRDVERQLADKTTSARDLSTENEQLKGRLRDADALRAEYVRLRTATTESEFLKSEVARLQQELHALRVTALGARAPQRPARGTDRQVTAVQRTIGESLARVIERFADDGTRSSALADTQGFPLASSGTDGIALAAYAAHLYESASRAKDYLPVSAPSSIELVDTNGVRVSLWSFDVDADRLVLANLAVSPVDAKRVETTLGDLTHILSPSNARKTATP
jgi:hypothetical protein